ncbi:MAG: glycosyltransferase family 1 protein [Anaerolineales bacterium]|nr:glycosyltransferase family 1 protein [Anaerolineales bacterium]
MNVTIFGAGSLGDIQPCLRLGQKLQQAGFHITLAAPQNFASIIQGQQVAFHPLRGDMQKIMAGDTGRRFMERGGTNPFYSIFAMRKMLGPIAIQMAEEALAACQNADALITLAVFAPFGKTIAEIRRIPLLLVEPTPVLPTRNFPAPGFPIQRNLGGALNRLTGFAMLGVIWQWYRPFVNKFRKHFGLRRLSGSGFHRILISTPLLSAYSPSVIPQPQDWSPNVHITGYWFQDSQTTWKPSARLLNFLEQGEPPVYVGFGSMTGHDPESITKMALAALTESGRRGVIATGWGGIKTTNMPKNILALDAAPHDWLFPRMAAVVHHGGAGTTAEGLRAGVPTVTVPFIVDQLFWGTRVHSMGAGTKPIQAHGLTGRNLAEAIQMAGTDPLIRRRAESIGERIRSEDGIGNAVKIVREYLGA